MNNYDENELNKWIELDDKLCQKHPILTQQDLNLIAYAVDKETKQLKRIIANREEK